MACLAALKAVCDAQARLADDPRFLAVVGIRKLDLFRAHVRALDGAAGLRLDDAERAFLVRAGTRQAPLKAEGKRRS